MDHAQSTHSQTADGPAHVVRNLVLGVLLFLGIEAAVFRSGVYPQVLTPDSYAGHIHHFVEWTAKNPASSESEIALFGDSRAAEGFSAKIADSLYADQGLRFLNFATPGATLRVQYYLLRQIDPHANRFSTVALGIDNYDDLSTSEDLSDRSMDLRFLTELLRYEDAIEFPSSFPSKRARTEAAATCLLKGHAYKLDLQDFLESPAKRLRIVKPLRDSGFDWGYEYTGRSISLAGFAFDGSRLKFPPTATREQIADLQGRLDQVHYNPLSSARYRREWLGRIVDRYRESPTHLIMLQMPRGPFNWIPAHPADTTTIDSLRTSRNVSILDRHVFEHLENPKFFADSLHLNHEGREAFSRQSAAILAQSTVTSAKRTIGPPAVEPSLWVASGPGNYEMVLEPTAPHMPLAAGFYKRDAGLNYVTPQFWFTLPAARDVGAVKVTGYLNPLLARLLPITMTAKLNDADTAKTLISKDGSFEFEVPCAAPDVPAKADRLSFRVDKTLVPKSANINNDERALSVGIVKIEYMATSVNK
jgi:hypothetical protein